MFFFISVKGNKFPVTRNIVYFTGKDPSVTDTPFVTVSFLVTCVYILSCDRKCSFYYKKYSFLVKFGSSFSVYSIFATHVRNLQSKFPVGHSDILKT